MISDEDGKMFKGDKWLTELGSWFRSQRVKDRLWVDVSVNHGWWTEAGMVAVETPMFFTLADPNYPPKRLLAEAIRRKQEFLPESDRIPLAVSQLGKGDYVAVIRLQDLIDLTTDAVIGLMASLDQAAVDRLEGVVDVEDFPEMDDELTTTDIDDSDEYEVDSTGWPAVYEDGDNFFNSTP